METTKTSFWYSVTELGDELLSKLKKDEPLPKWWTDLKSLGWSVTAGDLKCTWWLLPKAATKLLKPLTKLTDKYSLTLYKCEGEGDWYFDVPYLLTWKESLCGGTEKVLDTWFEKLSGSTPTSSSKLKCLLSPKPLKGYTTKLTYYGNDKCWSESSYYLDETTDLLCWFCPYLPWLFDGKPKELYVKFSLTK